MHCAERSGLVNKSPAEKIKQQLSIFKCPKDKQPLYYTSLQYDDKLTFDCQGSICKTKKNKLFVNSLRYYCKQCKYSCCKGCKSELWKNSMPKCKQRCPQGHELTFKDNEEKGLAFCDGCLQYLTGYNFNCETCSPTANEYSLCVPCTEKNDKNFIGTQCRDYPSNVANQIEDEPEEEQEFNLFGDYKEESDAFGQVGQFFDDLF